MTTPPRKSLDQQIVSARRRFLARLGIGSAAIGALIGSPLPARAQPAAAPRRHAADDWMDALPAAHRMVFDAVSAQGAEDVRHYAANVFAANRSGYGLESRDIGVIVILRHEATPFAFNDAIWAKYGKTMGGMLKFNDPNTKQAPTTNVYNSAAYGMALTNFGNTIDALVKRGTRFAICDAATHFIAGQLAGPSGNAEAIYKEFAAATIPNSRFVPAGVVGVTRAQERGYAMIYAG